MAPIMNSLRSFPDHVNNILIVRTQIHSARISVVIDSAKLFSSSVVDDNNYLQYHSQTSEKYESLGLISRVT